MADFLDVDTNFSIDELGDLTEIFENFARVIDLAQNFGELLSGDFSSENTPQTSVQTMLDGEFSDFNKASNADIFGGDDNIFETNSGAETFFEAAALEQNFGDSGENFSDEYFAARNEAGDEKQNIERGAAEIFEESEAAEQNKFDINEIMRELERGLAEEFGSGGGDVNF